MVAPMLVGTTHVALDATTGNTATETFTYSGSPTAGNTLVLTYGQGVRSLTPLSPFSYTVPSDWAIITTGWSTAQVDGSLYHGASGFIAVRLATGTEASTTFEISHDAPTGNFGMGRVYEFEANDGVQASMNTNGVVANPSGQRYITASSVSRTCVTSFVGTNDTGGSFLSDYDAHDFQNLTGFRQTGFKMRTHWLHAVGSNTPLPQISDPDAGAINKYPWCQMAILLGPTDNRHRRGLGMVRG